VIDYSDHIYYKDGFRFRLERPARFQTDICGCVGGNSYVHITADGDLFIQAGYCWDGASGPTMDTISTRRAALAHDALYQLIRLGYLPGDDPGVREKADALLQRLMDEDSPQGGRFGWLKERWNDFRGFVWYRSVRRFGGSSAAPQAERKELVAP